MMNEISDIRNNRILVVDDNPAIHEDIRKILRGPSEVNEALADAKALLFEESLKADGKADFEIDSAFQGEEGLRKVKEAFAAGRPYALAFVDVRMPPGWDGVETITRIWRDYPELQVVICTAYSDYTWEEMIRQIGKSDSLLILKKPFDNIEVLQLAHALTEKWALNHQVKCRLNDLDQLVVQRTTELRQANEKLKAEIAERMQIEKSLRLSEERFSKAFKASPIPLAIQSLLQETLVDVNQGFQQITGYNRAELIGHTPEELKFWGETDGGRAILQKLHEEMSVRNMPCRLRTKTGEWREVLVSVEPFELDEQPFLLIIAQDISEQIRLENELRHSQKMEAVGQLAAGVAHDFNNILTVVQGYTALLLDTKPPDSKDRKPLQNIAAAADRATKLVRQLLTFSRKQIMQFRPMNVRETLARMAEMLPRLLGEHITVLISTPVDLPGINADAGMIEQMLLNLAVNARDAMPDGGRLSLTAGETEISPAVARQTHEARPGRFVCLNVSDTGCGIPPEFLPRIFEPFFTTKGVGKGTGLGLATVYGIVKQHHGWIEVQSQPGQGCTFRVFIPAHEKPAETPPPPAALEPTVGGSETILVAEDEEAVRDFVVQVLKSRGYTVLSAESGVRALEQWSEHQHEIDLLLTDLVMPGGISGHDLAQRLLREAPKLKVIYTSGYSPGLAGKDLALLDRRNFLAKPHGPSRLLRAVREILDRAEQPAELALTK
jgi:two-component system, cell cycle sensor histidine kinase and response regulator CckA